MKHGGWGWIMLLGLLAEPALAANKCIDASGRIIYQAAPCPANTRGGDMSLNVNRPFTGQAKSPAAAVAPAAATGSGEPPIDSEPGRDTRLETDAER